MAASSELSLSTPPSLARITNDPMKNRFSWCANSVLGQWLQVDLGHLYVVSGVATQGSYDQNAWVTKYQLSCSKDGTVFAIYKENNLIRVREVNV